MDENVTFTQSQIGASTEQLATLTQFENDLDCEQVSHVKSNCKTKGSMLGFEHSRIQPCQIPAETHKLRECLGTEAGQTPTGR